MGLGTISYEVRGPAGLQIQKPAVTAWHSVPVGRQNLKLLHWKSGDLSQAVWKPARGLSSGEEAENKRNMPRGKAF